MSETFNRLILNELIHVRPMKKIIFLLFASFLFCNFHTLKAQQKELKLPENYLERHPLYDYVEDQLSNTDSIADYASKPNPLKITGTVFLNDGITPAKNVILFINQADEHGNYELKTEDGKRYVYHRGWIKTGPDGKYTFYTFIPGKERYSKALKSIHLAIKDPQAKEQIGYDFVFDNDPRLSKSCRKRLKKHGLDTILKPERSENILVAKKNIVLEKHRHDGLAKN